MEGAQNKMAGESCLYSYLSCFQIPDLSHHNNVGVLTKKGAQADSKGEPYVIANLHLVNSHDVIHDRIFSRADVHFQLVQLGKCRVSSRRLPTPRGPSHKDHSGGLMD